LSNGEKWRKISEQWCFSNGKKGKNEEKYCWKVMFRQ
jgi:hypothetical protein